MSILVDYFDDFDKYEKNVLSMEYGMLIASSKYAVWQNKEGNISVYVHKNAPSKHNFKYEVDYVVDGLKESFSFNNFFQILDEISDKIVL